MNEPSTTRLSVSPIGWVIAALAGIVLFIAGILIGVSIKRPAGDSVAVGPQKSQNTFLRVPENIERSKEPLNTLNMKVGVSGDCGWVVRPAFIIGPQCFEGEVKWMFFREGGNLLRQSEIQPGFYVRVQRYDTTNVVTNRQVELLGDYVVVGTASNRGGGRMFVIQPANAVE